MFDFVVYDIAIAIILRNTKRYIISNEITVCVVPEVLSLYINVANSIVTINTQYNNICNPSTVVFTSHTAFINFASVISIFNDGLTLIIGMI